MSSRFPDLLDHSLNQCCYYAPMCISTWDLGLKWDGCANTLGSDGPQELTSAAFEPVDCPACTEHSITGATTMLRLSPTYHNILIYTSWSYGTICYNTVSEKIVVALALGVPSLLVAATSLWITYLTYTHSRIFLSPPASCISSLLLMQYRYWFYDSTWPSRRILLLKFKGFRHYATGRNLRAVSSASCVNVRVFVELKIMVGTRPYVASHTYNDTSKAHTLITEPIGITFKKELLLSVIAYPIWALNI